MTLEEIKELALDTQRREIRTLMLANYVGNERIIEKWNDFRFHLSWFFTPTTPAASDTTVRKWMRRLVEAGAVEVSQWRKGGSIKYRFPRELCDPLADEAIKHWQAVGYSQDERRLAIGQLPQVQPPKSED